MKRKHYSNDFKRRLIQEANDYGNTAEIARRNNISSQLLYRWKKEGTAVKQKNMLDNLANNTMLMRDIINVQQFQNEYETLKLRVTKLEHILVKLNLTGIDMTSGNEDIQDTSSLSVIQDTSSVSSVKDTSSVSSVKDNYGVSSVKDNYGVSSVKDNYGVSSVKDTSSVSSVKDNYGVSSVKDTSSVSSVKDNYGVSSVKDTSSVSSVKDNYGVSSVKDTSSVSSVKDTSSVSSVKDNYGVSSVKDTSSLSSVKDTSSLSSVKDTSSVSGVKDTSSASDRNFSYAKKENKRNYESNSNNRFRSAFDDVKVDVNNGYNKKNVKNEYGFGKVDNFYAKDVSAENSENKSGHKFTNQNEKINKKFQGIDKVSKIEKKEQYSKML